MSQANNMIPMAILTGYLGAGKTTLLNRILNGDHEMRIAVLVNDFGSINIDSKLIVGVQGETITLSNGCICCTIRGDLVDAIAGLVKSGNPPDYIIVEASGVSEPSQIVLTFNRSILRNDVRIDSIIAVVDADQFANLEQKPERLLHEQIRVSDIVLLNKVDLVDDETIKQAHAWIESIIDKARIIETSHCNVPMEVVIGNDTYNPQTAFDTGGPGVHAHDVRQLEKHSHSDHSLVFATWSWETDQAVSLPKIRAILDQLPVNVFRAKGIIYSQELPDIMVILQLVGTRVSLTEGDSWGDQTPKTSIVLIGDIRAVEEQILDDMFTDAEKQPQTANEVGQFIDGILRWIRKH